MSIVDVFEKALNERATAGKKGWEMEDSEAVALQVIRAQKDGNNKDIKLTPDREARIKAALQITPARVLQFIKMELKQSGVELDETSEEILRKLVDLAEARKQVVATGLVEKGGKGKKKAVSFAEILRKSKS